MTTSNDVVPVTLNGRPVVQEKTIWESPSRTFRNTLATAAMQIIPSIQMDALIKPVAARRALVACSLMLLDTSGKVILV